MTATAHARATDRGRLTLIRAARLYDGSGTNLLDDPTLVIDGHTITAVDRASALGTVDNADVVDLAGATLLPGLIDTHVHLCFDAGPDVVDSLAAEDDVATLAAMAEAARANVARGVTTVRDLGDRSYLALALRDMHQPGLPTIVASGPPITSVAGHCHFLGGEVFGLAGMRDAVRRHAERDVDVIKIMASGGHLTPGTHTDRPQFTRAELRAAVEEAHRFGLPVTAHAHDLTAIEDALSAAVDGLEHATFQSADGVIEAPAALLEAIAASGVAVGLTLGAVLAPGTVVPPFFQANLPRIEANVRRVIGSGATVVLGTDAGIGPVKPHGVLPLAVQQFAGFGPTPAQALRTVTSHAAEVIGLGHRKGRLAPGYDADILAVDGNPLDDLSALHQVRAVFARGTRIG